MTGKTYEFLAIYGIKVVGAIALFVIGRWVVEGIARFSRRFPAKRKPDETLSSSMPRESPFPFPNGMVMSTSTRVDLICR